MSAWTEENEAILEVLAKKAFITSRYHERLYYMYNNRLKYIKIPIIVVSGINSVIAVGLADYVEQTFISATNSVLALICGVLGSIELFLKVSDNMVISLAAARELYVLHIEIRKTLKLRPDDRGMDAKTYLDNVYTRYVDIIQNSKLVITADSEHDFNDHSMSISEKIRRLPSSRSSVSNSSAVQVEPETGPGEDEELAIITKTSDIEEVVTTQETLEDTIRAELAADPEDSVGDMKDIA